MVELRIKSGLSLPTCRVDSSERGPEKEVGGRYFWQQKLPERRKGGEGNSGSDSDWRGGFLDYLTV